MIIHAVSALAEACRSVEAILHEVSLRNIAWRGHFGALYYKNTQYYSRSLASISASAKDDLELCYLASGWQLARLKILDEEKKNLVIVVNDLSTKLLCTLEDLHRSHVQATVIFIDALANFIDQESFPGVLAQAEGLIYPPPLSVKEREIITQKLKELSGKPGVKILHLVNSTKIKVTNNPPIFDHLEFTHRQLKDGETLERVALKRIARDLRNYPQATCIWASSHDPFPFKILAERLQIASVDGAITRASGVAASGLHPLLIISTIDVAKVVGELLKIESFPITILLIDAGLISDEEELPQVNRYDLALFRFVKDMIIGVPSDEEEARAMLCSLLATNKPGLLRLSSSPSVGLPFQRKPTLERPFQGRCLYPGEELAFLCLGSCAYNAMLAANTLKSWGVSAAVYSMDWLNPLDEEIISKAVQSERLITVEEHSCRGALGTAVMEFLQKNSINDVKLKMIGIRENVSSTNLEDHGLSMEGLLEAAKEILGN